MIIKVIYLALSILIFGETGICYESEEDSINDTVYGLKQIICYSEIDSFFSKENSILLDKLIDKIDQNLKLFSDFINVSSKSHIYNYIVFKSLSDPQIRKYYGIVDSVSYEKTIDEYLYFFPIHEDSQKVFTSDEFNNFLNEYIYLFKKISALLGELVNKHEKTTSFGLLNLEGITIFLIHKNEKYAQYGNGFYYADLLIARMNEANLLPEDFNCDCLESNCVGFAAFETGIYFIYPLFYMDEYIGDFGISINY